MEKKRKGMDQTQRRRVVCSISGDMWILWRRWGKGKRQLCANKLHAQYVVWRI